MNYNPHLHHRKSIRFHGYDYSKEGAYFITICCLNKKNQFGNVSNGEMILNEYGQIAHNEWLKTTEIRPNVRLDVFIIMPNHIHGIIIIDDSPIDGRGELHSPIINDKPDPIDALKSNLHPIDGRGELHSPIINDKPDPIDALKSNLHPIDGRGELHSPIINRNPVSPMKSSHQNLVSPRKGECNSPLRSPSNNVGAIIRGYKSSVTKQINLIKSGETIWQRNYYDIIIHDEQSYQNMSDYIIDNPAKWNEDEFYNKT
ncbi:MAG: hypothetical protein Q8M15_03435 [Bacteroidota bacterium]|nr:hypothetical protein [Bacteroidota bacterium]